MGNFTHSLRATESPEGLVPAKLSYEALRTAARWSELCIRERCRPAVREDGRHSRLRQIVTLWRRRPRNSVAARLDPVPPRSFSHT